jgi:hypothetical protein
VRRNRFTVRNLRNSGGVIFDGYGLYPAMVVVGGLLVGCEFLAFDFVFPLSGISTCETELAG